MADRQTEALNKFLELTNYTISSQEVMELERGDLWRFEPWHQQIIRVARGWPSESHAIVKALETRINELEAKLGFSNEETPTSFSPSGKHFIVCNEKLISSQTRANLGKYFTIQGFKSADIEFPRAEISAAFGGADCEEDFSWYGMVFRGPRDRKKWVGYEFHTLVAKGIRRKKASLDALFEYYHDDDGRLRQQVAALAGCHPNQLFTQLRKQPIELNIER
jgi:hypothetical protein